MTKTPHVPGCSRALSEYVSLSTPAGTSVCHRGSGVPVFLGSWYDGACVLRVFKPFFSQQGKMSGTPIYFLSDPKGKPEWNTDDTSHNPGHEVEYHRVMLYHVLVFLEDHTDASREDKEEQYPHGPELTFHQGPPKTKPEQQTCQAEEQPLAPVDLF